MSQWARSPGARPQFLLFSGEWYNAVMIIAVLSDLHDNLACWQIISRTLRAEHIEVLVICGDTCAPATLERMAQDFPGTIHTVYGNVADRDLETSVAAKYEHIIHHGDRGGFEMHGTRIGFVHYPAVAETMAKSGEFDLVCYGHDHLKRWAKMDDCFLLNPGTAAGMFQYPSWATVDLKTMGHVFREITL